jgi:hypothetical protein
MACCAFAVFLAMQLLVPVRWLSGFLSGKPADLQSGPNTAVDWSPFDPSPESGAAVAKSGFAFPQFKLKSQIALIIALEIGLGTAALGGVATLWPARAALLGEEQATLVDELTFLDPLHGYICGRDGATTKREIS